MSVDASRTIDNRAVWGAGDGTIRPRRPSRTRPAGRAAFQAYARSRLRPVFERLGWRTCGGRIRRRTHPACQSDRRAWAAWATAGARGSQAAVCGVCEGYEVARRESARPGHSSVAGREADHATYNELRAFGRKATSTEERNGTTSRSPRRSNPELARRRSRSR